MLDGIGLRLCGVILASGMTAAPALAGTYTTLYQFTGGSDGMYPSSSPTYDEKGDLYGTASGGGGCSAYSSYGCGTVYKLGPSGQLTVLVTFSGTNGSGPGGPLTLVDHELYGNTGGGGPDNEGELFSVHTNGTRFRLLHTFTGTDGQQPVGSLIPGPAGSFYGITSEGGTGGGGVLFELRPGGRYIKLHDFTDGADGAGPNALIIDASGTLYGGTYYGSPGPTCRRGLGCGVVFEYVPSTSTFTVLHQLAESEGLDPMLGSVGPDGTLYGATRSGPGSSRFGSLFQMVPADGAYNFSTLYSFEGSRPPGSQPTGGPILTRYGALIGTTGFSPALYRFKDSKMEALYTFTGYSVPVPPIVAKNGTIYGASSSGGISPCDGLTLYGSCGYLYSFVQ